MFCYFSPLLSPKFQGHLLPEEDERFFKLVQLAAEEEEKEFSKVDKAPKEVDKNIVLSKPLLGTPKDLMNLIKVFLFFYFFKFPFVILVMDSSANFFGFIFFT